LCTKFCESVGDLKLINIKCCKLVTAQEKKFLHTLCCDAFSRLLTAKTEFGDLSHFPSGQAYEPLIMDINQHNVNIYGSSNLYAVPEGKDKGSSKFNVFCALLTQNRFRPFIFAECTVTGEVIPRYAGEIPLTNFEKWS
jgi:hypothetical protein